MSIPRKVTVTCPECGKKYQVTVFDSVNTDYAPDIAETIISGERFDAPCPSCGFVAHLEYDVLYHDMKHSAMIWVVHTNDPDYKKKVAEIREIDLLPYKVTRIVSDMNALREKVACLEAGRDDRVVELCKVFLTDQLHRQRPDFKFRNSFYTFSQGKEIVFFYDTDGKEVASYLEDDVYNLVKDVFQSVLMRMDTSPYQIIDASWAVGAFKQADAEREGNAPSAEAVEAPPVEETIEKEEAPRIRFCRKCGFELLPDSLFCSYCGTKVVTL